MTVVLVLALPLLIRQVFKIQGNKKIILHTMFYALMISSCNLVVKYLYDLYSNFNVIISKHLTLIVEMKTFENQ